jgi:hypothetical protein
MRGMGLIGLGLIAISALAYRFAERDLTAMAALQPVGFWQCVGTFFSYWWPYAIAWVVGINLWQRRPKHWNWLWLAGLAFGPWITQLARSHNMPIEVLALLTSAVVFIALMIGGAILGNSIRRRPS